MRRVLHTCVGKAHRSSVGCDKSLALNTTGCGIEVELIRAYGRCGALDAALFVYQTTSSSSMLPSGDGRYCVSVFARLCAPLSLSPFLCAVHPPTPPTLLFGSGLKPHGVSEQSQLLNAVLLACARCGDSSTALSIFRTATRLDEVNTTLRLPQSAHSLLRRHSAPTSLSSPCIRPPCLPHPSPLHRGPRTYPALSPGTRQPRHGQHSDLRCQRTRGSGAAEHGWW